MKKWLLAMGLCLVLAGCSLQEGADGTTKLVADPAKVEAVEETATGLLGVLAALSVMFPPAGVALGGLAGALGLWAKHKNRLKAGYGMTDAIDDFKTEYPDEWLLLKPYLTKNLGAKSENAVRTMRGLPPIS